MNEGNLEHSGLTLRERNRLRLRQRILDAAAQLFRTIGYEQATMDLIAGEAGVSRATLFNYFPNKQALLLPFAYELYTQKVQPVVLAYLTRAEATPIEALRMLFLSIQEDILIFPGIAQALQAELLLPDFQNEDQPEHENGFLEMILMILAQGQNRREVRTDLSAESLVRYITALYISLLHTVLAQYRADTHFAEAEAKLKERYQHEVEQLLLFLHAAFQPINE